MGFLPSFSTGAGFRWPIHSITAQREGEDLFQPWKQHPVRAFLRMSRPTSPARCKSTQLIGHCAAGQGRFRGGTRMSIPQGGPCQWEIQDPTDGGTVVSKDICSRDIP